MPINKNIQFGKTKNVLLVEFGTGDIELTYSDVRNGKIILGFQEHEIPHEIDKLEQSPFNSFDEMKPPLIFSFSNPKSIDGLIHQLQDMKKALIDEELVKELQEQNDKDKKILEEIKELCSEELYKEIIEELETDCSHYNFSIVEKPTGDLQELQMLDYEHIKEIWVEQHTGFVCDDYYGYVYILLPNKKYLRASFQC